MKFKKKSKLERRIQTLEGTLDRTLRAFVNYEEHPLVLKKVLSNTLEDFGY